MKVYYLLIVSLVVGPLLAGEERWYAANGELVRIYDKGAVVKDPVKAAAVTPVSPVVVEGQGVRWNARGIYRGSRNRGRAIYSSGYRGGYYYGGSYGYYQYGHGVRYSPSHGHHAGHHSGGYLPVFGGSGVSIIIRR